MFINLQAHSLSVIFKLIDYVMVPTTLSRIDQTASPSKAGTQTDQNNFKVITIKYSFTLDSYTTVMIEYCRSESTKLAFP